MDDSVAAIAARNVGLASPDLAPFILPGAIFHAEDKAVAFVTDRIPGASIRTPHERRPVIVLQSKEHCQNRRLKTVQIVPCSSSHRTWPPESWNFPVPANERAFTKPRVVALLGQAQPILKSELIEHLGDLDPETLFNLWRAMCANSGMLSEQVLAMQPRP